MQARFAFLFCFLKHCNTLTCSREIFDRKCNTVLLVPHRYGHSEEKCPVPRGQGKSHGVKWVLQLVVWTHHPLGTLTFLLRLLEFYVATNRHAGGVINIVFFGLKKGSWIYRINQLILSLQQFVMVWSKKTI